MVLWAIGTQSCWGSSKERCASEFSETTRDEDLLPSSGPPLVKFAPENINSLALQTGWAGLHWFSVLPRGSVGEEVNGVAWGGSMVRSHLHTAVCWSNGHNRNIASEDVSWRLKEDQHVQQDKYTDVYAKPPIVYPPNTYPSSTFFYMPQIQKP